MVPEEEMIIMRQCSCLEKGTIVRRYTLIRGVKKVREQAHEEGSITVGLSR